MDLQSEMVRRNAAFEVLDALDAPDGDADVEGVTLDAFDVPVCDDCGGLLKPDVVCHLAASSARSSAAA